MFPTTDFIDDIIRWRSSEGAGPDVEEGRIRVEEYRESPPQYTAHH